MKELVRVVRCQAEIYEYLAREREECSVEEYVELCGRVNRALAGMPGRRDYRLHFGPRRGAEVIKRIDTILQTL